MHGSCLSILFYLSLVMHGSCLPILFNLSLVMHLSSLSILSNYLPSRTGCIHLFHLIYFILIYSLY